MGSFAGMTPPPPFNSALFSHLETLQRPLLHANSTQAAAATRALEAQLLATQPAPQLPPAPQGAAAAACLGAFGLGFQLSHTDSFSGQELFPPGMNTFSAEAIRMRMLAESAMGGAQDGSGPGEPARTDGNDSVNEARGHSRSLQRHRRLCQIKRNLVVP